MALSRSLTTFVSIAVVAFLALFPAAQSSTAAVRTGTAFTLPSYQAKTSPDFPGMKRVSVSYDDATKIAAFQIELRSPLADPTVTSALRKTDVSLDLGSFLGEAGTPDRLGQGCGGYGRNGFSMDLSLNDLSVTKLKGDLSTGLDRIPIPAALVLDPSRTLISLSVDLTNWVVSPNPICVIASMSNGGSTKGEIAEAMFNGFDWTDGDVFEIIETQLDQELNGIEPNMNVGTRVSRLECESIAQSAWRFHCDAVIRLRQTGKPLVRISGTRSVADAKYKRLDVTGVEGVFLGITNRMTVRYKWTKCPHRYRANGKKCPRKKTWRGRGSLSDVIKSPLG